MAFDDAGNMFVANPASNEIHIYVTSYQSLNFELPSNAGFVVGGEVPLTATATSGLPVSYLVTTPNTCAVHESDEKTLRLLKRGECALTASVEESNEWNPAASVERSVIVATKPSKPTDVVALPQGDGTILLDWDAPADTGEAALPG